MGKRNILFQDYLLLLSQKLISYILFPLLVSNLYNFFFRDLKIMQGLFKMLMEDKLIYIMRGTIDSFQLNLQESL